MIRNKRLSKSIADVSWGEFTRQLAYKSGWAGRELVAIDQFFPSTKRCSCCGFTLKSIGMNVEHRVCPECNSEHDRDINAAINIKAAGHAVLALGENVNLVSSSSSISCSL